MRTNATTSTGAGVGCLASNVLTNVLFRAKLVAATLNANDEKQLLSSLHRKSLCLDS